MGRKNHKAAPWMCGQCKTGFETEDAVRQHIRDRHRSIQNCGVFRCVDRVDGPEFRDTEPSFADRAIAASLAIAMGEPTDDAWLLGE